jgi:hypothetical protein
MSTDTDATWFGFTWGETDDVVWLTDGEGDYKKVDPSFLATLQALARGERTRGDLSEKERVALDHLLDAGYLHPDGTVRRAETPSDIRLWPRLVAFGVAFLVLTVAVLARVLGGAATVPTVATGADLELLVELLKMTPVFVGLALVHEAGHYLASRPYFDPDVDFTLLNGVFPALVTKTNDAWRCPRNVRIWINLAGPFVDTCQTLVLVAASVFLYPGSALLAMVPVFEYFRILFALNPLVRGDGYWMVVDAFGAVNLHTRGLRDLRNRRPSLPMAYALTSSLFTVAGLGMMAYFISRLVGIA